jgi:hypothetical protein
LAWYTPVSVALTRLPRYTARVDLAGAARRDAYLVTSLDTDQTMPFGGGAAVLPRRSSAPASQTPKILLTWTPRQAARHSSTAREIAEARPPALARQRGGEYAAVAGGLAKVEPKEAESRSVEHRAELPRGGRSGRSTSKKVVGRDALVAGDRRRLWLRGEATVAGIIKQRRRAR